MSRYGSAFFHEYGYGDEDEDDYADHQEYDQDDHCYEDDLEDDYNDPEEQYYQNQAEEEEEDQYEDERDAQLMENLQAFYRRNQNHTPFGKKPSYMPPVPKKMLELSPAPPARAVLVSAPPPARIQPTTEESSKETSVFSSHFEAPPEEPYQTLPRSMFGAKYAQSEHPNADEDTGQLRSDTYSYYEAKTQLDRRHERRESSKSEPDSSRSLLSMLEDLSVMNKSFREVAN